MVCPRCSIASIAMPAALRRSASNVPRLTSSASARATNSPTSSGAIVIDGIAPAASSMLAEKFCATDVGDAVHARRPRANARQNVGSSGEMSLDVKADQATASQAPSAGMIRIRFDGLADASQPGMPGTPLRLHSCT